jgi:hypothetical protein
MLCCSAVQHSANWATAMHAVQRGCTPPECCFWGGGGGQSAPPPLPPFPQTGPGGTAAIKVRRAASGKDHHAEGLSGHGVGWSGKTKVSSGRQSKSRRSGQGRAGRAQRLPGRCGARGSGARVTWLGCVPPGWPACGWRSAPRRARRGSWEAVLRRGSRGSSRAV